MLFRHDIAIILHKRVMISEFQTITRVGPNSKKQSKHIENFEYHREALTSLGYFEHLVLPLRYIAPRSDEWRNLFRILNSTITNVADGYFEIRGYEPSTPREVILWIRPDSRAKYEAMISNLDQAAQQKVELR